MPCAPHEVAVGTFHDKFHEALIIAGLKGGLRSLMSTNQASKDGIKIPDDSWEPSHTTRDQSRNKPTLVVEVAYTQAARCPRKNVTYWLHAPGAQTRTVVALNIDRKHPTITIEKWGLGQDQEEILEQSITINR
ncbi:hypothetical protein BDV19DRAFT_390907 [Aspergillus venezuelensis]